MPSARARRTVRQAWALFEALGPAEKPLHANPGTHGKIPGFETDGTLRFFARHLGRTLPGRQLMISGSPEPRRDFRDGKRLR
ncbi:hypothetical protein [[Kitasatospora] papulosa]|uniref:hypothetical protein n=1 Tax=[Kitasatospora] papulosa TaxID=1464011 RepID=UPI0035DCB1BD